VDNIAELERRISAALDRIGAGVDKLALPAPVVAAVAGDDGARALEEALETEKMANAQLEERVKAIRERQETTVAALEQQVATLTGAANKYETTIRNLKRVNAQLRDNNSALRDANTQGIGDAHLVNKAMLTELESLRADRAADTGELDAILSELEPLIGKDT
jgi:chromosome segregation ATPase